MTPFYEDYAVTLWHADARDMVPLLGVYQHAILDPPYDAQTHAGARGSDRSGGGDKHRIKVHEIAFAPIDSPDDVVQLVSPTRWAIAFSPLELLGDYRRAAGAAWTRAGVWDRIGGSPQFTGDRPAQGAEGLAIWHSEHVRRRWNRGGKRGIWRHNIVPGGTADRVHETQKPLSLLRDLVLDFTDPDELILDCFAGSGTTGVAAKICGRRAVLIELNAEHCKTAARRLAETSLDERVSRVKGVRAKQGAIDWATGVP